MSKNKENDINSKVMDHIRKTLSPRGYTFTTKRSVDNPDIEYREISTQAEIPNAVILDSRVQLYDSNGSLSDSLTDQVATSVAFGVEKLIWRGDLKSDDKFLSVMDGLLLKVDSTDTIPEHAFCHDDKMMFCSFEENESARGCMGEVIIIPCLNMLERVIAVPRLLHIGIDDLFLKETVKDNGDIFIAISLKVALRVAAQDAQQ